MFSCSAFLASPDPILGIKIGLVFTSVYAILVVESEIQDDYTDNEFCCSCLFC